jgi:hypothetical protein
MDNEELTELFIKVLSIDRSSMLDFIKQHNTYDELCSVIKNMYKVIYKNKSLIMEKSLAPVDIYNVFNRLMIGRSPLNSDYDKYGVYTVIPTMELADILINTFCATNSHHVCYMFAGMGLVPAFLNHCVALEGLDIKISASDDYASPDVCNKPALMSVSKKSLYDLKYYMECGYDCDSIVMDLSQHIHTDVLTELVQLIEADLGFKSITIIGRAQTFRQHLYLFSNVSSRTKYQVFYRYPKAIYHLNDYSDNNIYNNTYPSDLVIASFINRDLLPIAPDIFTLECKYNEIIGIENIFSNYTVSFAHDTNFNNYQLIRNAAAPPYYSWLTDVLNPMYPMDHDNNRKYVMAINFMGRVNKLPNFLTSYDEFEYWSTDFPASAHQDYENRADFLRHVDISSRIRAGNLEYLHEIEYLPSWIQSKDVALHFLKMDYTTGSEDKLWKSSMNNYNMRFIADSKLPMNSFASLFRTHGQLI